MAHLVTYHYPNNKNILKAHVVAKIGGGSFSQAEGFQMGVSNKTDEFLAKYRTGQVPAADTPDGPLFQSDAIAKYVARTGNAAAQLLGRTAYESSVIDAFVEFVSSDLGRAFFEFFAPYQGWAPHNPETEKRAFGNLTRWLGVLERELNGKDFIVAGHVTFADISAFGVLNFVFGAGLTAEQRAAYPNLVRYVAAIGAREEFASVYGPFAFFSGELTLPAPK